MSDVYSGKWVTFARDNGRWSLYHKITNLVVGASSPGGLASTGDVLPPDTVTGRYWLAVCGSVYPASFAGRVDPTPPRSMTCLDCYLGRKNEGQISMSVGAHYPKIGTGELKRLEDE